MRKIDATIDSLSLDPQNPRIERATGHLDALNRIVASQKDKLYKLASDIVERGLSPFEKLVLLESSDNPGHYTVIEGNRRTAALKLLSNDALDGQIPYFGTADGRKFLSKIHDLRQYFDASLIEPIDAVVVPDRASAQPWLQRRHAGEMEGVGLTSWTRIEMLRAFNPENKLVALADFLRDEVLDEDEYLSLANQWSTVERLIESDELRKRIGLSIGDRGILGTSLTIDKLESKLRAIIGGLTKLDAPSRKLNTVRDRLKYLDEWLGDDSDDAVVEGSFTSIAELRRAKPQQPVRPPRAQPESTSPPRTTTRERKAPFRRSEVRVSDDLAAGVYRELCVIKAAEFPVATTMLLRQFLEISLQKYAKAHGLATKNKKGFGLTISELLPEVHKHIKDNDPNLDLEPVTRNLAAGHATHQIGYFHAVVHGKSTFPSSDSIMALANEFRSFLIHLWGRVK